MTPPIRLAFAALILATPLACAAAEPPRGTPPAAQANAKDEAPWFATVDGVAISALEYEQALREAARQKFYHGSPPENQVNELKREVGFGMIDRILLKRTAKARGIGPDKAAVDAQIATYEARYKDSPRWQQERDKILPGLRARLEEDSALENLEKRVRSLPPPPEKEVRAYYAANPDKFTEPEKLKLGIILLTVDPSSTSEIWDLAFKEAGKIHDRLKAGEDFAKLAALHSGDESAASGGEMDYMHRGMAPSVLQERVDTMKVGEVSEPLRILEGVALFRLIDRVAAVHHPFERVQPRATDLYNRDRENQAWTDYKAGLRKQSKLLINTERYPVFAEGKSAKAKP